MGVGYIFHKLQVLSSLTIVVFRKNTVYQCYRREFCLFAAFQDLQDFLRGFSPWPGQINPASQIVRSPSNANYIKDNTISTQI